MNYTKHENYNEYVKEQTIENLRKINSVWVDDNEIRKIVNYIKNNNIIIKKGICHGVRNGYEVQKFRELLNTDIIGTDISYTVKNYPNCIQWDFHEIKSEWINNIDFIYSNSIDHSYDFEKCLNNWMLCLTKTGRCFIEWSEANMGRKANKADCFMIEKQELIDLIKKQYVFECDFKIETKVKSRLGCILVIKHF
jgi:hypothetical protein